MRRSFQGNSGDELFEIIFCNLRRTLIVPGLTSWKYNVPEISYPGKIFSVGSVVSETEAVLTGRGADLEIPFGVIMTVLAFFSEFFYLYGICRSEKCENFHIFLSIAEKI